MLQFNVHTLLGRNGQSCGNRYCADAAVGTQAFSALDPCQNNGQCRNTSTSFTCNCTQGYAGDFCQQYDYCAETQCDSVGALSCENTVTSAVCRCKAGYSGPLCSTNIDECASDPCQSGSTCLDGVNAYTCLCTAGWTGADCSVDIDECLTSPCRNGATCMNQSPPQRYTCTCQPGYTGLNCDLDVDECSSAPCDSLGSSACLNQLNSYQCQCHDGFSGEQCSTATQAVRRLASCGVFGYDLLEAVQVPAGTYRVALNGSPDAMLSGQVTAMPSMPFLFGSWFWLERGANGILVSSHSDSGIVEFSVQIRHQLITVSGRTWLASDLTERRWHYVTVTGNSSHVTVTLDDQILGTQSVASPISLVSRNVQLGSLPDGSMAFNGMIHNPTLSFGISSAASPHVCLLGQGSSSSSQCGSNGRSVDLLHGQLDCVCNTGWTGPTCGVRQTQVSSGGQGSIAYTLSSQQQTSSSVSLALRSEPSSTTQQVLSFQRSTGGGVPGQLQSVLLNIDNSSNVQVLISETCSSTSSISISSDVVVTDGAWHNVSVSSIAVAGTVSLSVDGVQQTVSLLNDGNAVGCTPSTAHLQLGHVVTGVSGCLDDITLDTVPLAATSASLSGDASLSCQHDTARFHGLSQLRLQPVDWSSGLVNMSLRLRTASPNGTLYFIGGDRNDALAGIPTAFILLEVTRGFMQLTARLNELDSVTLLNTNVRVDNNAWHSVSVYYNTSTFSLTVDSRQEFAAVSTRSSTTEISISQMDVCFGAVTADKQLLFNTPTVSAALDGCVQDYYHNGRFISFFSNVASHNVAFGQCNV